MSERCLGCSKVATKLLKRKLCVCGHEQVYHMERECAVCGCEQFKAARAAKEKPWADGTM